MTPHLDASGTSTSGRGRTVAVLAIGVLVPVLLLVHGRVLGARLTSPLGWTAVLGVFSLLFAAAGVSTARPACRLACLALPPVAGGLVAVTLAVGTAAFPGVAAWWVPGALVTAAPVLVLAALLRADGAGGADTRG